jgi:glutamate racemase
MLCHRAGSPGFGCVDRGFGKMKKTAFRPFWMNIVHSLKECDTVILGCTHYPLVTHLIAQKVSGKIVDSIEPIILSFCK